jgi:hypothetical protein
MMIINYLVFAYWSSTITILCLVFMKMFMMIHQHQIKDPESNLKQFIMQMMSIDLLRPLRLHTVRIQTDPFEINVPPEPTDLGLGSTPLGRAGRGSYLFTISLKLRLAPASYRY